MAIKFGMSWLVKRFPGIPQEAIDIIEKLLTGLGTAKSAEEVVALKKQALVDVKAHCDGIGNPSDIKGE